MTLYVRKPTTYNAIPYTGDFAAFKATLATAPGKDNMSLTALHGDGSIMVRSSSTWFDTTIEILEGQYLVYGNALPLEKPFASDLSDLAPYGEVYVTEGIGA